jgi:hypothetical protein
LKIYVASSWRNQSQPAVVRALREAGHAVYDFHRPEAVYDARDVDEGGFSWGDIDPNFTAWTAQRFRDSLSEPVVEQGFARDMDALRECDACLMLQPCGRSAALELGWAAGAGKLTLVLLADQEPELMLKMAHHFCLTIDEVLETLAAVARDG